MGLTETRALAVVIAIVGSCACSSPAASSSAPVVGPAAPVTDTEAVVEDEGIVVIAIGSEPRRQLAFELAIGESSPQRLSLRDSMRMSVDGQESVPLNKAMPQSVEFHLSRTVVGEQGDWAEVEYEVEQLLVDGDPRESKRREFTVLFSAAGNVRKGAKKLGIDIEKHFRFVLPRAAIGVGAQWTEESEVELEQEIVRVVRQHELVGLDGSIATIETSFGFEVEPRFAEIEGLPEGAHAWLSETKLSGSFVAELDLFAPPPLRASTEMVVRTTVEVRRGQDVLQVITTTLESLYTVEPLDSAP